MRLMKQWNRLPREAVDPPFLETLDFSLDGTVNSTISLVQLKMSLAMVGVLDLEDPCQPKLFYGSAVVPKLLAASCRLREWDWVD